MNDTQTAAELIEGVTIKHFDVLIDKDGKEVHVEVNPSGTEEKKAEDQAQSDEQAPF